MTFQVLYIIAITFHCAAYHANGVSCDDVHECANMRVMGRFGSNEIYRCQGEQSCVNSKFTNVSVHCVGAYSCENTSITMLSQKNMLTATASFALKNAIITFAPHTNVNTSQITLNGYYAALNTSIYCMNEIANGNCSNIEINCNGYGCYGNINSTNNSKTLSHYTVNKNIVDCISIDNDKSTLNDTCIVYHGNPYSIGPLHDGEPKHYHNRLVTSYLNVSYLNNKTSMIMCLTRDLPDSDLGNICSGEEIVLSADEHDIVLVCGAAFACNQKWITIESSTTNNENDVTIVCSGKDSCDNSFIYIKDINNNNNNNYNYNSNYSTVICSGEGSCSDTTLYGINNVYFIGTPQSDETNVYSIYSGGRNIGGNFNVYIAVSIESIIVNINCIENDECNLICDHYQGCIGVTLNCFVNAICNIECSEKVYGIDENQNGDCATIVNHNQTSPDDVPYIYANRTVPTTTDTTTKTTPTFTITTTRSDATVNFNYNTTTLIRTIASTAWSWSESIESTYTRSLATDPDVELGGTNTSRSIEKILGLMVFYAMISIFITGIGCTLFVWIYHTFIDYQKGCDAPKYISIFYIMRNIGDLYSDTIFCLYLGVAKNEFLLFLFATSLTLISHFMSNFMGFKMIKKFESINSNMNGNKNIININYNTSYKYVKKYDLFLLIMSMFAGFYATVEIASSRLFYLDIFNLRLGSQDISNVNKYYFYNIVLFENGSQIIIQLIYISKNNGLINIFVFFTMFFSVASLLIGIFSHWSHINKQNSTLAIKFAYRKKKQYLMHIISKHKKKSKYNLGNHCFCYTYHLFESKLSLVLNVDLFNIVINLIDTDKNKSGILIYFEVNNVDLKHQTFDEICQNVDCLSDAASSIARRFEYDIRQGLGFSKKSKLQIQSVKMIDDMEIRHRQIDLVSIVNKEQDAKVKGIDA